MQRLQPQTAAKVFELAELPVLLNGTGAGAAPVVPFPAWERARDRACAALLAGETRLLLTGPAGTGKSTLVQEIARVLRYLGWEVTLTLADVPQTEASSQAAHSAWLIDEADRLEAAQLVQLLRTCKRPLVLVGLDTLASRVKAGVHLSLAPLNTKEARAYVAQWLRLAGYEPGHLEPDAIDRLIELAAGVPRLLATILRASCWVADGKGAAVISRSHVEDAAALRACLLDGDPDADPERGGVRTRRRARSVLTAVLAMAALTAAGFAGARLWPAETDEAVSLIRPYVSSASDTLSRALDAARPKLQALLSPAAPSAPEPAEASPPPVTADPVPPPPPPSAELAALPPTPNEGPTREVEQSAPASEPESVSFAPQPELDAPVPSAEPAAHALVQADPPPPPPARMASAATAPREGLKLSVDIMELLLSRGRGMMAIGDLSAARLLFGRAAEAGSVEGMLAMGRSFDPVVLSKLEAHPTPDPAQAALWYRRAADFGSVEAAGLLARLAEQAAPRP